MSSFKTMSGWLQMKAGHKWIGYEFKTSGVYLHYFASGKEKAMKTLLRNQITAVKLSGKQHKGAENCFEVHFSGVPGSPWLLSAPSKEDCINWMENLQPGSSGVPPATYARQQSFDASSPPSANYYSTNVPHPQMKRSNTFPNATEPPLYQQQPPLYQQQPPLYQQQHPQAQQYNYGTTPQYPNQGNYFSGANLPPVQDFYDTFSTDAQAPPKGPYIKMFSPEQVTALAHMFKGVIDNYSDQNGASEYLVAEGKKAGTVPSASGKGKDDYHVMAYDKDSAEWSLNDSKIYAKPQEVNVMDELADSLQQMQKDAMTIKEEYLSQFKSIGQGQFGVVESAVYTPVPGTTIKVAIKKTIDCGSVDSKEDFLREIAVMTTFVHPNIVRVYGSVDKGGSSSPWLVLEYLPNGDLKSFLMKNPRQVNQLVKYMIDVAMGMHYLSEKKCVHRDLAARNVLMDQNELCKVGDFGLLRKTTKDDGENYSYMMQTNSALPIRWMAVESLTEQNFSSASDVWSFGILMWELFNPSLPPYHEITNNSQVVAGIVAGKRLEIPPQCPKAVAQVMRACWIPNHTKRPSFLVIANLLQHSMMQMQPAGSK